MTRSILLTVVSVLLSNSSLYQSASVFLCRNEILFPTVLLDLCPSIKSWSSDTVCNDFAVFMFSSFIWSCQIVSNVQTKLKVVAFVACSRITLCFERNVCKRRSSLHPPFWKFSLRSHTEPGLILWKFQTGNRAIWLVDFLYQPSQELSRAITVIIDMHGCWLELVMSSTIARVHLV